MRWTASWPRGQIELGDEAAGAKARCFPAQGDDAGFEGGLGFMGAGKRGAGLALEAVEAQRLETAEPFADGAAGAAEAQGGGFDAVGAGESNELVAEGEMGIVGAEHGVTGLRSGWRQRRFN